MAPDNINLCYASSTLTSAVRITLMVSAEHYRPETIQAMDALSVWGGADKRRRSEHMHKDHPRPEVQELSWEINVDDIGQACAIMRVQQNIILLNTPDYLRGLKKDPRLELADRMMSGNGIYPTLGRETTA